MKTIKKIIRKVFNDMYLTPTGMIPRVQNWI